MKNKREKLGEIVQKLNYLKGNKKTNKSLQKDY
jgi:hypothetical protein